MNIYSHYSLLEPQCANLRVKVGNNCALAVHVERKSTGRLVEYVTLEHLHIEPTRFMFHSGCAYSYATDPLILMSILHRLLVEVV